MDGTRLYALAVSVAAALAAALVVVLAFQKRALEGRVEDLSSRLLDPYPGMPVPSVTLESLSGDSVTLGDGPHLQLLIAFSTTCEPCVASLVAWTNLYSQLQQESRVEVFGLAVDSADATRAYVAEHRLDFPVATFTDRRVRALYRTRRLPQVLLLDAFGRVRYARFGALSEGEAADSLRAAIRAALATHGLSIRDGASVTTSKDAGSLVP